jgi:hypothetical protein
MEGGREIVTGQEAVGASLLCAWIRLGDWLQSGMIRTLAVDEHIGALPVCSEQYGILIYRRL